MADRHGRDNERRRGGGDDDDNPHVQQEGGEVSLSIEETNKLRISLGLKPLNMEAPQKQSASDVKRQEEKRQQQEQEKTAEELRAKIAAHKSARQQESFLAVRGLAADDDDDMASWAEQTRKAAEKRQRQEEEQRQQQRRVKPGGRRADDEDEEEEDGGRGGSGRYGAQDLAGLKLRHGVDDVGLGEEVVLTLADRSILDEKGNLDEDGADELENVRLAEEKKRKKAREAAAPKAKPLWEEDGKRRGILDKYDEEDEQLLQLDGLGGLESEQQRHRDEMRRKLAEGGKILDSAAAGPAVATGDYLTSAELPKANPEGKKRKKKERKIRAKAAAVDDEDGDTSDLIAALEAQQGGGAAGAGAAGGSDLGARSERMTARERAAAAAQAGAAEKRARFEAALEKSNWASQALKPVVPEVVKPAIDVVVPGSTVPPAQDPAPKVEAQRWNQGGAKEEEEEPPEEIGDEADRELQLSLERARRLAQQQQQKQQLAGVTVKKEEDMDVDGGTSVLGSLHEIAVAAARQREQEEEKKKDAKSGLVFNDTMDFVSNISTKKEPKREGAAAAKAGPAAAGDGDGAGPSAKAPEPDEEDDDGYMGVDRMDEDEGPGAAKGAGQGRWVSASKPEGEEEEDDDPQRQRSKRQHRQPRQDREEEEGPAQDSITGQAKVGKGLAGVLSLLKDKGTLQEKQIWAGRNSDKSKVALQGLEDVYTGGSSEDRVVRSVEMALTRKDEFGRVLTPKERFRNLCYQFHGKGPSKNKVEKRLKQAKQELQIRKQASEQAAEADKLLNIQEKTHQPFIVLSGKGVKETQAAMASMSKTMPPPPNRPPAHKSKGAGSSKAAPPKEPSLGGVLGGGLTPLVGDRKVEAMLAISKPPPA